MVYTRIIDTLLASKIFFPLRNQNLVEHKLSVTLHYTILQLFLLFLLNPLQKEIDHESTSDTTKK